MSKGGGKGRISNHLVAASCAAILTVYGAGYWRTRDEARRLETQAQERRPPRPTQTPSPTPAADELTPPPAVQPPPPSPPEPAPAVTAAVEEPKPKKKTPVKVAAATPTDAKPVEPEVAKPAKTAPPEILSVPIEEPLESRSAAAAPAAPAAATPTPEAPADSGWRDGTYTGWGYSNHGDIQAKVIIEHGRIVGSGVATCATRYPCDVIDLILFQPVERQSPEVDRVSRATESADAYYYGLIEALKKAETPAAATAAAPP